MRPVLGLGAVGKTDADGWGRLSVAFWPFLISFLRFNTQKIRESGIIAVGFFSSPLSP